MFQANLNFNSYPNADGTLRPQSAVCGCDEAFNVFDNGRSNVRYDYNNSSFGYGFSGDCCGRNFGSFQPPYTGGMPESARNNYNFLRQLSFMFGQMANILSFGRRPAYPCPSYNMGSYYGENMFQQNLMVAREIDRMNAQRQRAMMAPYNDNDSPPRSSGFDSSEERFQRRLAAARAYDQRQAAKRLAAGNTDNSDFYARALGKGKNKGRSCNIGNIDGLSVNLSSCQMNSVSSFQQHFDRNRDRYDAVSVDTGVHADLIASIHWREGSGDFSSSIRDGESSLKGSWVRDAIGVINEQKGRYASMYGNSDFSSAESKLQFAEMYNGLGYKNKGEVSPYVFAGTSAYTSGKYVKDGVYDPNCVDKQPGVAVLLKSISA